MKLTRLSYFAYVVTVAMLFQPVVFAAQQTGAGMNIKEGGLLETGQSLPLLDILSGGEISVSDSSFTETPWSSRSL